VPGGGTEAGDELATPQAEPLVGGSDFPIIDLMVY